MLEKVVRMSRMTPTTTAYLFKPKVMPEILAIDEKQIEIKSINLH
jgi:hypothetical protein